MRILFLVGLMAISQVVIASEMSLKAAKDRADYEESKLSPANSEALLTSQATVLDKVLSTCPVSIDVVPPPLTVVLELDAHGSVIRTWRSDETTFVKCFDTIATKSRLFVPPHAPFYTSFEIDLRAKSSNG